MNLPIKSDVSRCWNVKSLNFRSHQLWTSLVKVWISSLLMVLLRNRRRTALLGSQRLCIILPKASFSAKLLADNMQRTPSELLLNCDRISSFAKHWWSFENSLWTAANFRWTELQKDDQRYSPSRQLVRSIDFCSSKRLKWRTTLFLREDLLLLRCGTESHPCCLCRVVFADNKFPCSQ